MWDKIFNAINRASLLGVAPAGLALYEAIADGNLEKVKTLTQPQSRPLLEDIRKEGAENPEEDNLFFLAKDNLEILEHLMVVYGEEEEMKNQLEDIFFIATEIDHKNLLHIIYTHQDKIFRQNYSIYSRLVAAIENRYTKAVAFLLKFKSDKLSDQAMGNFLQMAVDKDDVPIFHRIFKTGRVSRKQLDDALERASENGRLSILDCILKQNISIDERVLNRSLLAAAENGHVNIVRLLLIKCEKYFKKDTKLRALFKLSKHGNLVSLEVLNLFLQDEYILKKAARQNNRLYREALFRVTQRYQKIANRLKSIPSVHLIIAAEEGNIKEVNSLMHDDKHHFSDKVISDALMNAAKQGHKQIIELFFKKYHNLMNFDVTAAFVKAAENSHTDVVALFIKKFTHIIDDKSKLKALISVCKKGDLTIFNELMKDKSIENIAAMDHNNVYHVVKKRIDVYSRVAATPYRHILTRLRKIPGVRLNVFAEEGNLNEVEFITQHHANDLVNPQIEEAFYLAASAGHKNTTQFLLDKCNYKIYHYVTVAFNRASEKGFSDIIKLILEKHSNVIDPHFKRMALRYACTHGQLDTLNTLVDDPTISILATYDNNILLRDARANVNDGPEDAALYQPIVDRLLQIPEVYELDIEMNQEQEEELEDLAEMDEGAMADLSVEENTLLSDLKEEYRAVYEAKGGWTAIRLEILSYLAEEYKKAPVLDGYQRVWMLPKNSKIEVTYVPSDTIGLHPIGDKCVISWKDARGKLKEKRVPWARVEAIYQKLSKGSLLHHDSQDKELLKKILTTFNIPAYPNQDKPLPLECDIPLSPAALVGHYRHAISNAYRYLSDYNPLMAKNASFVVVDETTNRRRANIEDASTELFAYYWIALNDDTRKLEAPHTIEDNLLGLAAVFQSLNRGHNIDKKTLYPKEQTQFHSGKVAITCRDDLKADYPTCKYGVDKRMVQSHYGHPLTRTLDVETLRKFIEEQFLKEYLFPNLVKLSDNTLQNILDEIENYSLILCGMKPDPVTALSPEEEAQKKQAFVFSSEQYQAFIEVVYKSFIPKRIDMKRENIQDPTTQKTYTSYIEMINDLLSSNLLKSFPDGFRTLIGEHLAMKRKRDETELVEEPSKKKAKMEKPLVFSKKRKGKEKAENDENESDKENKYSAKRRRRG